jgi:hypothetical protein
MATRNLSAGAPADGVGPVLTKGTLTDAVVNALRECNHDLACIDRGAYLRISVPRQCRLERAVVERHSRAPFRLPADLEAIMPSFKGRLRLTEEQATWTFELPPAGPTGKDQPR